MSFRIYKCLSTNELLSQVMRWDVLMGHFPLLRPQVSSSVGLLLVPERAPHQFSPVASIPGASCEEGRISGLAPPKPKSRPAPQTAPPPASTSKVMTSTRVLFLAAALSPTLHARTIGKCCRFYLRCRSEPRLFSAFPSPPATFPARAAIASPPVLQPAWSLCFSLPPSPPPLTA